MGVTTVAAAPMPLWKLCTLRIGKPCSGVRYEYDPCTMRARITRTWLSSRVLEAIMQYGRSQEAIDGLTAEQRRVTQKAGTERPFTGEYNDHKEPGIYVDIVSGEPPFASSDKFESGCGRSEEHTSELQYLMR